jgi:hypothetical protein
VAVQEAPSRLCRIALAPSGSCCAWSDFSGCVGLTELSTIRSWVFPVETPAIAGLVAGQEWTGREQLASTLDLDRASEVVCIDFLNDQWLACSSFSGRLTLIDVFAKRATRRIPIDGRLHGATSAGNYIVVASDAGFACVDAARGRIEYLIDSCGRAGAVVYAPPSLPGLGIGIDSEGGITGFRLETGEVLYRANPGSGCIGTAVRVADKSVVLSMKGGDLMFFDAITGTHTGSFQTGGDSAIEAADDSHLVVGTESGEILLGRAVPR